MMVFDCNCYVTLIEDDERYQVWKEAGIEKFPLKHPLQGLVTIKLKGQEPFEMNILLGDASKLTVEQKEKLLEQITSKFGVNKRDVKKQWKKGIPIKAERVIVTICTKHSHAMM